MKTIKKKTKGLQRGAFEEQILDWVTSQDVFDRIESGVSQIITDHSELEELLEAALFEGNKAQLNMRIPPAMKAVLSKLAKERTTDATTLVRIWLAERIRKELGRR